MRTLRTLMILLVTAGTVSACGKGGKDQKEAAAPVYSGPVRVVVDNKHWQDVIVYLLHDGERSRVGTATAAAVATFDVPPHMLGQTGLVRLIADPIGSREGIATETLVVKPGQQVQWTLESQLRRSSVAVY